MVATNFNLKTPRLNLSPIVLSEADEFYPHLANDQISLDMAWTPHETIGETKQFILQAEDRFKSGSAIHWTIRFEERVVGLISLIDIRRTHRAITYNRAELAYWLTPSVQRLGLMSEACKAVIEFSFSKFALIKLIVSHHVGNTASKMLIKKMGFRYLYREELAFTKNGKRIDVQHYDLSSEAWEKFNLL
jgi:ribosomal-protein-alanine N-acetyltransferase